MLLHQYCLLSAALRLVHLILQVACKDASFLILWLHDTYGGVIVNQVMIVGEFRVGLADTEMGCITMVVNIMYLAAHRNVLL